MAATAPSYQPLLNYAPEEQAQDMYYPQPPPVATTTTVVTQPVVVTAPVFRDYPVLVTGRNGQQVQTVLEYRIGLLTWVVFGVLLLIGLLTGLICLIIIPFFMNDLKDVYHINPTDGMVVGVYKRMG